MLFGPARGRFQSARGPGNVSSPINGATHIKVAAERMGKRGIQLPFNPASGGFQSSLDVLGVCVGFQSGFGETSDQVDDSSEF